MDYELRPKLLPIRAETGGGHWVQGRPTGWRGEVTYFSYLIDGYLTEVRNFIYLNLRLLDLS